MENQARLILEDGSIYSGVSFGAEGTKIFELVFNTAMVGYQEIISDPSYTGQAVVMTYPLIGNYGVNEDDYETGVPTIAGLVVRDYNDKPSNFRSKETLAEVMKRYDICGIAKVDTRKLARHIRDIGSMKAMITSDAELEADQAILELKRTELDAYVVEKVSTKQIYQAGDVNSKYHVVLVDCGVKKNIINSLIKRDIHLTVVPYDTDEKTILNLKPDGVFISNGPGDPAVLSRTIETIRQLRRRVPIFGICLGHQLISLGYGAATYKLKFGHRGANHPVKNLANGKVEMTSQNHSYAVSNESLSDTPLHVTHMNLLDGTIEGVECMEDYVKSVQYHPESTPGPNDSRYLFDEFVAMLEKFKEVGANA